MPFDFRFANKEAFNLRLLDWESVIRRFEPKLPTSSTTSPITVEKKSNPVSNADASSRTCSSADRGDLDVRKEDVKSDSFDSFSTHSFVDISYQDHVSPSNSSVEHQEGSLSERKQPVANVVELSHSSSPNQPRSSNASSDQLDENPVPEISSRPKSLSQPPKSLPASLHLLEPGFRRRSEADLSSKHVSRKKRLSHAAYQALSQSQPGITSLDKCEDVFEDDMKATRESAKSIYAVQTVETAAGDIEMKESPDTPLLEQKPAQYRLMFELSAPMLNKVRRNLTEDPADIHLFDELIEVVCASLATVMEAFLNQSAEYKNYVELKCYAQRDVKYSDFELFRVLGKGAFGSVSVQSFTCVTVTQHNPRQIVTFRLSSPAL